MFGCIGGVFRLVFVVVILALLGAAVYYYQRNPDKAPWKGGVASVQEKVGTVKLGAEVRAAVSLRESLKNLDISVSAEKDVVTLRGKVQNSEVSRTVESVASSVPGVRQVVNFLEIDNTVGTVSQESDDRTIGERVDDEALELKVRAAFKLDKSLADAGFEVKAMKRVIRLTSPSATAEQKKRALDVARSIEGVASVSM
jgi:osmotically-inducible protein OsmY